MARERRRRRRGTTESEAQEVPKAPAYIKRKIIIDAVEKVVKIETATEPRFQEFFVDAMKFSVSPVKEQKTNKVRRRKKVS